MKANSCEQSGEVAAFLAEELTVEEERAFTTHLAGCAACRGCLEKTRDLVGLLTALPAPVPPASLHPQVLARVAGEGRLVPKVTFVQNFARPLALAAALSLFCGLALSHLPVRQHAPRASSARPKASEPPVLLEAEPASLEEGRSVRDALSWLSTAQEPDGSWSAARWGGDRRFQPALTALPLLALVEAAPVEPDPVQEDALRRAQANLCHLQDARGAFGATFQGAPYNQGIATLALLHAYSRQPEPLLKRTLDAALALIIARQTEAGGWGYLYTPLPNLSVSLWHIECLRLAADLGWEEARAPLQRSLAWHAQLLERRLAADVEANEPATSPSREALSPQGDFDYCRTYFLAADLRRDAGAASREQLASLRSALREAQVHEGELSGSWRPDDRWSKVGGRIYTTALATLTMR